MTSDVGFETRSLEELSSMGTLIVNDGYRTKRPELGAAGFQILRVAQVQDGTLQPPSEPEFVRDEFRTKIGAKVAQPGDIILTTKGTVGRRARVPVTAESLVYSPQVCFFRVLDEGALDPDYLYYWLGAPEFLVQAAGIKAQTDMADYISLRDLRKVRVSFPRIEIQREVGQALRSFDDRIELSRRMSETLEGIARTLFRSWFVDLDPVRAKMDGRVPSGLSLEMAGLFPSAFSESELGSIPKGWRVRSLGEWVDPVRGRSYKSVELQDSRTALVTLKSFQRGGGYRPDGLKAYAGPYKPEQVVTPGEVVVACTDVTQAAEVIGRPAMVEPDPRFDVLVASLDELIARLRDSRVGRPFVYLLLSSEEFASHAYAHTSGTTVLHLDRRCVPEFRFAAPPDQVLAVFNRIAEPMFASITENKAAMRTLGGLRDTLLPRLISGEVRMKSAEQLVDAAH